MICKNCGTQNDNDSKFCKNCASPLENEVSENKGNENRPEELESSKTENVTEVIPAFEEKSLKPENKTRSKGKMKKLLAIVAVIAIIVVAVVVYNATKCKHNWIEADCINPSTCSICNKTSGKPLGHDWSEATCTDPQKCRRCGVTEGVALGHDWEDATCTEARKCTRCGETVGESLGHSVDDWKVVKDSTCSETGVKEGICNRCGEKVEGDVKKKSHKTGGWKIEKKATLENDGIRYKICSVCKQKVKEEKYKLSKEERVASYKEKCGTYSYKEIARNPDKYEGKYMKFTGKVIQVQEASSFLYYSVYRISVTNQGYGYYDDTVYVTCDNYGEGDRILEDDIVTFYGECKGTKTYETVMGAEVTIPWVEAEFIELN